MKRNRRIVSDGTNVYVATQDSLQKVVVSTGVSTTLVSDKRFNTVTYGNSTLYAADQDALYSVNTVTGELSTIVNMTGITEIMYFTGTNIIVLKGNSLINLTLSTGLYTYIRQDM